MTEPLAEPDQRGQTRIARPHQAEPSSPPRRRNDLQRLHQTRIDPDPFERSVQRTKLDGTVGSSIEMLQSAAAASAEMQAWRIGTPRPGSEPLDNPTLTPCTSCSAESGAHAVARHRERQKDRCALVLRNAIPLRPEPLDRELQNRRCAFLISAKRPRHHLLL